MRNLGVSRGMHWKITDSVSNQDLGKEMMAGCEPCLF